MCSSDLSRAVLAAACAADYDGERDGRECARGVEELAADTGCGRWAGRAVDEPGEDEEGEPGEVGSGGAGGRCERAACTEPCGAAPFEHECDQEWGVGGGEYDEVSEEGERSVFCVYALTFVLMNLYSLQYITTIYYKPT